MTRTLSFLVAIVLLAGCASEPGVPTGSLVASFDSEGQWLDIAVDDVDATLVTLDYGTGEEVRSIAVETRELSHDGELTRDGEAALSFMAGMDSAFLSHVRIELLDSDDSGRAAELGRAVLLDLAVSSDGVSEEDGVYKAINQTTILGAATTVQRNHPGCGGSFCACSGEDDCSAMFLFRCGGKPNHVCFDYGSFQRCYCW